ncbi:ketoacyl-ACP synthase III family protein [Streptomyces sp. NBC_01477]|uniref:ketoacyl-ACP synthase III family protein n=1 Tax=Streptomyces sp. NBC_01477 TaxID=2976015 RepID=UPI002E300F44|nr:ketoacyl-ACP synthase III family protein [Streptomyces sp. NBC_01477]
MRTPDIFIKATGRYLPETVSVEWAVEQGHYPARDAELHELLGVTIAGDTPSPDMALWAAQEAFKRSGQRAEDLDLLLYVNSWHQGPDGWQPQYHLQRQLVGGDVLAVNLQHGCNGMFSALELAAGHLQAGDRPRSALIVAADNFGTPLIDRWTLGPFIAADAGSAVILTTDPGFARLLAVGSVTVPEGELYHRGAEPMFPPGATTGRALDFVSRHDHFREQTQAGNVGSDVLAQVHRRTSEVVLRTLSEAGTALADITRVACMNFSREIVEQRLLEAIGLPMSLSTWESGRRRGHAGPSDQLISFDELVTTGEVGPGDHVLMLGMGPGITISCAVVKVLTPAPWGQ